MRVWCVGAGAIGGTVAARLARAGVALRVIDANPEHVRRLRDPGLRLRSVDGDDVIGRLDGALDERLVAVGELLARAFPTRTTPNIRGALWGKMLVNSVTVLGALGGLLFGELIDWNPAVLAHIVAEGVDVAAAE